jgi:hypothetical protein
MHPRRFAALAVVAASAVLFPALPFVGTACNSPCSYNNGVAMFQVTQPNGPTSAIPICGDGGVPTTLSSAATAQCAAICTGDFSGTGCCLSQWEPDTVDCQGCP